MPLEEDARLLVGLCRGASGVGDRAVARSVAAVEESLLDAFDGDALDGNALQVRLESCKLLEYQQHRCTRPGGDVAGG